MTQNSPPRPSSETNRWPLAVAALLVVTLLSGCAAFPMVGPSCGPGETDIADVGQDTAQFTLKGSAKDLNDTGFAIDDGTGDAWVVAPRAAEQISGGACIIVMGGELRTTDSGQYDAFVVPEELLKEEYVIEDE